MIESIVCSWLNGCLEVPAYMEHPEEKEDSYVIIEKTGSNETNRLKSATLAIQSYDVTLEKAALLNEAVKTAMDRLAENDEVSACRLNSDYNSTDTASKRYRYQAVFTIFYY